jgi:phage shock protein PspC (stress-responsive transcriptional regulator)
MASLTALSRKEPSVALSDELSKLEELHQRGALTAEEYARAKERLLQGHPNPAAGTPALDAVNGLRRSRSDRWIAGVCGGIGASTGVASWVWRLSFALVFLFGGAGLLLYILLWIFVPED